MGEGDFAAPVPIFSGALCIVACCTFRSGNFVFSKNGLNERTLSVFALISFLESTCLFAVTLVVTEILHRSFRLARYL